MAKQKKISAYSQKDHIKQGQEPSWVASSFGDIDHGFTPSSMKDAKHNSNTVVSMKRNRSEMQTSRPTTGSSAGTSGKHRHRKVDTDIWVDKHRPKTQNELAVHKKKISEVELWLKNNIEKSTPHKAPLLLLTGPAGAGKTATIKTLAKEMQLEIQEWTNPLTMVHQNDVASDFQSSVGFFSQSQASLFQDFLTRANKYQPLQLLGEKSFQRKIILIEDIPNTFLRDCSQFHGILSKYKESGRCPVVFIISDTARGENMVWKLLPKDVQIKLGFQTISFNPVAPTSMGKVLSKIASAEAGKGSRFEVPCKSTLDALSTASSGDIRGAINALQFACLKDTNLKSLFDGSKQSLTKKSNKEFKRTKKGMQSKTTIHHQEDSEGTELAAIGGRDTSLFLFRALGKILYCKREPKNNSDSVLPNHLLHHDRDRLKFNPEDILQQTHMSNDMFNLYLHQNYPEFYSRIDDVVDGSEYISDADMLAVNWTHQSTLSEYSGCIATRGLIHCNSARSRHDSSTKSLGWKPLHKPQWWQVARQIRERTESAKALFSGHCRTPIELQTQLLPYLSLINKPLTTPGQISFLQEMNSFSTVTRVRTERLDERDVNTDGDELQFPTSSSLQEKESTLNSSSCYDNDVHIGDFDDDYDLDGFYDQDDDDW